ncbi:MAG TPA: response regulator [Caulobacteraceae bacterium]|jgi:CheY-like chemotaxis protein|nr:response regulator [Caulobacteraceae bacterium]
MTPASGSPIVLVVEDDGLVRQMSADELAEAGYQVLEAANSREAIAILESGVRVEVLFTDVNMPGELDGLGLARLAHDRWPRVRLLVTSGGARAGPEDVPDEGRFISKPYSLRRMCSLVDELVGARA